MTQEASLQDPTDLKYQPTTNDSIEPVEKKKIKISGRLNETADVQLSKLLSYILRHGAVKEQLKLRSDGFIQIDELLKRPKLKNWTLDDVYRVVAENEKQRFAIVEEKQPDGTSIALIRANQGHSLKVHELELTPVEDSSELPIVVHGTYLRHWKNIVSGGLKPMGRTHIHFAKGLAGENGVISGMRHSCEIFIYLDVEKCFQGQIQFFISPNGVILTEGLPQSKSIPMEYFKSVVHKKGDVLYPPVPDNENLV